MEAKDKYKYPDKQDFIGYFYKRRGGDTDFADLLVKSFEDCLIQFQSLGDFLLFDLSPLGLLEQNSNPLMLNVTQFFHMQLNEAEFLHYCLEKRDL